MPKTVLVATEEELLAEYATWTPIIDLLGKDIRGRKANCTNPLYNYQYPNGIPIRTLIEVKSRKEMYKGQEYTWITLFWEKSQGTAGQEAFDCGFSGYRTDRAEPLRIKFVD